jgi:hypothetical protein
LAEKNEEEERDYWFNRLQPITEPKQTWREKWLAKEENDSSGSGEAEVEVTSAKGDSNIGSGVATQSQATATRAGKKIDERRNRPGWTSTWPS